MIVDGDGDEEEQVSSSISPRSGIRVVVDNNVNYNVNNNNNNPNNTLLCRVCHSNQAKYTCPKCQLRYCSIDCYRNHTTTSAVGDDNNDNNNIPLCSETFFRDRVNQVLKLESKEQKQRTHQVLQRHYDDEKKNNHHHHHHPAMDDNDDDDNYNNLRSSNGITEEELLNLLMKLEALETNDNDNDTQEQQRQQQQRQQMDISQLQKLLSPAMRAQFEHDIMTMTTAASTVSTQSKSSNDTLAQQHDPQSSSSFSSSSFRQLVLKSVVQPWYPWWRPQIVPIQEFNKKDQDDAEHTQAETETKTEFTSPVTATTTKLSNHSTTAPTTQIISSSSSSLLLLDERLLKVPKLAKLVHNNKQQQDPLKSFDNHVLLYNLIEIVYITCWMLRLYNGTSNILLLNVTNTDDKNSPNGNKKNGSEIAMEVMTCIMAVSTVLQTPPTTTNNDNVHQRQRTTTPFVSLSDVLSSCVKTSTTAMKHQQKQKQRQPRRTTDTMANTSTITDNSNDDDLNYCHYDVIVGCNTPWNVLIEDVMLLVASHRMVGRILLELSDILKSAIRHVKNTTTVQSGDISGGNDNTMTEFNRTNHHPTSPPPDCKQTLKELRLIRKKVEFYLSWSQQRNLNMLGPELQHDIMTWMEHWNSCNTSM